MSRILRLVFFGPAFGTFVAAAVVMLLAWVVFFLQLNENKEKDAALAAPQPDAVMLADFNQTRDIHTANEVHIVGYINTDYFFRLAQERNGVETAVRYLLVLMDPRDAKNSQVARAAVVLRKDETEVFKAIYAQGINFELGGAKIAGLAGINTDSSSFASLAMGAIANDNLTLSPDFVFIDPFLHGRTAGLAQRSRFSDPIMMLLGGFAGCLALIGVLKLPIERKGRAAQELEKARAKLRNVGHGVWGNTTPSNSPAVVDTEPKTATQPIWPPNRNVQELFGKQIIMWSFIGVIITTLIAPKLMIFYVLVTIVYVSVGARLMAKWNVQAVGQIDARQAPAQLENTPSIPASFAGPTDALAEPRHGVSDYVSKIREQHDSEPSGGAQPSHGSNLSNRARELVDSVELFSSQIFGPLSVFKRKPNPFDRLH